MGTLSYDRLVIDLDDRMLMHLQVVMVQKLRRGESFLFSWHNSVECGGGRCAVWMNPAIPLYFRFSGGHAPTLNREWVALLAQSANSSRGLILTNETPSAGGGEPTLTVSSAAGSVRPISSLAVPE
jgi:hypothetical protein